MKFGTKAIHAGVAPDPSTGAIMTPIYQTSTYVQKSPGDHLGYEYSRTHNPTRTALQQSLAALENGKHGICFSSGLGAIDSVVKLFNPGDEIISTNDLYGGTYRLFTKVFERYGIKFHFVSMADTEALSSLVNERTKMVWVETPTNPMMNTSLIPHAKTFPTVICFHGTKTTISKMNAAMLTAPKNKDSRMCGQANVQNNATNVANAANNNSLPENSPNTGSLL